MQLLQGPSNIGRPLPLYSLRVPAECVSEEILAGDYNEACTVETNDPEYSDGDGGSSEEGVSAEDSPSDTEEQDSHFEES